MADANGNKARKPFWKRWWFWVLIALAVIGGQGGNAVKTSTPAASSTTASTTTQSSPAPRTQESSPAPKATPMPRAEFKTAFAAAYGSPISDVSAFSPQDPGSGHYRTEYRLGAYSDATGEHGTIGDMSIDMVEYDGGEKFRVYLTGPKDSVVGAYPALAKSMDPSLSDADIQASLNRFSAENLPVTDGLATASSATRINNDTLTTETAGAEAYIDANADE
ncbi:hypothetical protein [Bifidobacterium platyrrhinorum]|uniref:Uncharacterized protein n=1 Tax=Bifidobacterium platyrrhinorum TaxID=2661628 RepID=A0A6L9SU77_9BIFI|nr:hypothetical protein [Bifidobacterium platyrrhinorum]NEG56166.1 hypothetical protein [Bifidobacterium platyrrhinorum]